ncbi:hypothetical protein SNEBB_004512 [Seison nebaliae]|nr:hypothetical protein SNEBB_004512 [Seison nebaliae]
MNFWKLDAEIARKSFDRNKEKKKSLLENTDFSNISLRPYQVDGVIWMYTQYERKLGGILADEMGLGKTYQSLCYISFIRKTIGKCLCLIVCPLSIIENWENEWKVCLSKVPLHRFYGEKETVLEEIIDFDDGIVLTTYDYLKHLKKTVKKFMVGIFDEGHRFKNVNSVTRQHCLNISIRQRIILTGTPIQNNLNEFISLCYFVGRKGFDEREYDDIVEDYKKKIEKDEIKLKLLSDSLLLRRIKEEVLPNLPKMKETILYHHLTDIQIDLYKNLLARNREKLNESINLQNIMMQLRKTCCHPYLFQGIEPEPFKEGEHIVEASGKLKILDLLLKHLKSCGHRTLIFSQFVMCLDILQDYCEFRKWKYSRLDGTLKVDERKEAIERFVQGDNDHDSFIFLMSTRSGGVGLNLTVADTVIFYDSDFNPQNDMQAMARVHRIGQRKNVQVIRLCVKNSIEEIIVRRAVEKKKLSEKLLNDSEKIGQDKIGVKSSEIRDILIFGVHKLFETREDHSNDYNVEKIVGMTKNKEWQLTVKDQNDDEVEHSIDGDDERENDELHSRKRKRGIEHIYEFEGKIYNPYRKNDLETLNNLTPKQIKVAKKQTKNKLTSVEKEAVQKRREENRKKRLLKAQELFKDSCLKYDFQTERLNYDEQRDDDKSAVYLKHLNILKLLNKENSNDDSDDSMSMRVLGKLINVKGNVVYPIVEKENVSKSSIIIHCVNNSGRWSKYGIFNSISKISDKVEEYYKKAKECNDMKLGDVHLIPFRTRKSNQTKIIDYLSLIIVIDSTGKIVQRALDSALESIGRLIESGRSATIHLPRIGEKNRKGIDWYGCEKIVKKQFGGRQLPVYVYYFDGSCNYRTHSLSSIVYQDEPERRRSSSESSHLSTSSSTITISSLSSAASTSRTRYLESSTVESYLSPNELIGSNIIYSDDE